MSEPIFEHPDRWYRPAGKSVKGWPLVRCQRPDPDAGEDEICGELVDANAAFRRVHDLDHECREAVKRAEWAKRAGRKPWPDRPRRPRRPVVYPGRPKVTVPPRGATK